MGPAARFCVHLNREHDGDWLEAGLARERREMHRAGQAREAAVRPATKVEMGWLPGFPDRHSRRLEKGNEIG